MSDTTKRSGSLSSMVLPAAILACIFSVGYFGLVWYLCGYSALYSSYYAIISSILAALLLVVPFLCMGLKMDSFTTVVAIAATAFLFIAAVAFTMLAGPGFTAALVCGKFVFANAVSPADLTKFVGQAKGIQYYSGSGDKNPFLSEDLKGKLSSDEEKKALAEVFTELTESQKEQIKKIVEKFEKDAVFNGDNSIVVSSTDVEKVKSILKELGPLEKPEEKKEEKKEDEKVAKTESKSDEKKDEKKEESEEKKEETEKSLFVFVEVTDAKCREALVEKPEDFGFTKFEQETEEKSTEAVKKSESEKKPEANPSAEEKKEKSS